MLSKLMQKKNVHAKKCSAILLMLRNVNAEQCYCGGKGSIGVKEGEGKRRFLELLQPIPTN